jgi:RNase P subunit RPR2
MSILTEILKEAPLSALLQEKVKAVEFQRNEFKRELDDCRRLYQVLQDEHQKLSALHSEDIRIHRGIEFRRGKRTGDMWMGFCPKCHMPAQDGWKPIMYSHNKEKVVFCSANCGWEVFMPLVLDDIAKELSI